MERHLILIAHNLRSCHNVGSLLRTAEGLGVERVFLTGHTPYPGSKKDDRLPHIAAKMQRQIHKTALGAEDSVAWQHDADIFTVISRLKAESFMVAALEQSDGAIELQGWKAPSRLALVVGRETDGLETAVLAACEPCLQIPMLGRKESFNVVQAAAMALYECRFH